VPLQLNRRVPNYLPLMDRAKKRLEIPNDEPTLVHRSLRRRSYERGVKVDCYSIQVLPFFHHRPACGSWKPPLLWQGPLSALSTII